MVHLSERPAAYKQRQRLCFPPVIAILHDLNSDPGGAIALGSNQEVEPAKCLREQKKGLCQAKIGVRGMNCSDKNPVKGTDSLQI